MRAGRLLLASAVLGSTSCSPPGSTSTVGADAGVQASTPTALEARRALRQQSLALSAVLPKRVALPFGDTTSTVSFGPSPTPPAAALSTPEPAAGGPSTFVLPSPIAPLPDGSGRYAMRRRDLGAVFSATGFALALSGGTKDAPRGSGLSATLVGARAVQPIGEKQQRAYVSHYVGAPSKWQTHLPTYGQLAWEDVYPGVDMVVEPSRGGFAYRFVLSPGAQLDKVSMHWDGARGVRATDGGRGAEIDTELGKVVIGGLRVYAVEGGQRTELPAALEVHGDDVSVRVDGWTRGTLVVDPFITWSSYAGGSAGEAANGVAIDASGSVFVTGRTASSDLPTTGGFDATYGGTFDAFVMKLSGAGTLLWSSYLGGSQVDLGRGVAVDSSGDAFVTGYTSSGDFPTTAGFDTTFGGGNDAFVTKVSGDGALVWSSFLGASGDDEGYGIAVDASGNALVTGYTTSASFPASGGADTTLGGEMDAFVTKVSGGGTVLWSSFLGGGSYDQAHQIALDGSGNAWITGETESSDFPTSGGFDTTLGGWRDAFVTKMSGSGALLWSSYLGGSDQEIPSGVAVDPSGNAFVVGMTSSSDFFGTGGFDTTLGGTQDAFVVKVSSAGALLWSSYLGGAGDDDARAVAVDPSGNAFVTGFTRSTDFPTTGGFDTTFGGGGEDAFVTRVSGAGVVLWSSYLGGAGSDGVAGAVADPSGHLLVVGTTLSADFPATAGLDTTLGGSQDAFITKLAPATLARGASCTNPGACLSNFCVDGVCCDTACTGACQACSAVKKGGGLDGTCAPIADGADPDKECLAAVCAAGMVTKASVCNGAGACRADGTASCGLYACAASACNTSCASDAQCLPAAFCAGTTCAADRELGGACERASQCKSGFCADGVCCDKACAGGCEACTNAKKGSGADGACAPVAAFTDPKNACEADPLYPDNCKADGACDGAGACRTVAKEGTACGATTCSSGAVSGRTCDAAGTCQTATVSCSPYAACADATVCPTSCAKGDDCVATHYCGATSACLPKKANGAACGAANECTSGACADGVCCNSACSSQCEACNLAGSEGVCAAVVGAPRTGHAACAGDPSVCGGACDGVNRATCAYAPATRSCGGTCAAGTETASTCDGAGACVIGKPKTCGTYACDAAGKTCRTACELATDCADGFTCDAGKCLAIGNRCSDDGLSVIDPAGKSEDCAGRRCKGGRCIEICNTSADCAPTFVCSGGACVAPAAETDDGGGCALSARGHAPSSSASSGLALGLAALGLVGRRRRLRA